MSTTTTQPTLASFKKRIRVGTVLEAVGIVNPKCSGRRVVTKVGATYFKYDIGEKTGFWCHWPKAKAVKFESADTVTLYMPDGRPMTTLTIIEEGNGAAHEPKKRVRVVMDNMHPPIESDKPHDIAEHKARYSHYPWIAYRDDSGRGFAAKATVQNIDIALAVIGDRKMSLYTGQRGGMLGGREMADAWKGNAAHGWYL